MHILPPPSTLPPGSVVDSYRRDSGGPRQEQSTDQQLTIIEEFCKKHGLVHRHKFLDKAESGGSTDKRDDFERMIGLYHNPAQRPHGLILWSYARFAREIENSIYYKAFIRTNKIIIHSLIDDIPEGDYGRIVEFFIDMSNEEKRKQASKESKRGLRDLVLKYKCVPGTPPHGFKRKPVDIGTRKDGTPHIAHQWVPDPKLRSKVLKAFKLLDAGATLKEIQNATRLYGSANSYKTFFTNKLYIGILEYGGETFSDYCKPIVPIALWNRVQKRIRDRAQIDIKARHPRRATSPYLLSNIALCAQCGSPLNGNTVRRPNRTGYDYAYRCSRSKRRAGCTATRIPARALETTICEAIIQNIFEPASLTAHHQLALENQTTAESARQQRINELTSERAELTRQITNLAKAIADAGGSEVLLDALKHKETLRAHAKLELDQLDIPIERVPPLTPPQLAIASKSLIHTLTTATEDQRRQLLRGLLHEIRAEKTNKQIHGTISYYYPPPFDLAPKDQTLPMEAVPLGALLHRQRFTIPFTTARS